jgi:hypothetical protein
MSHTTDIFVWIPVSVKGRNYLELKLNYKIFCQIKIIVTRSFSLCSKEASYRPTTNLEVKHLIGWLLFSC